MRKRRNGAREEDQPSLGKSLLTTFSKLPWWTNYKSVLFLSKDLFWRNVAKIKEKISTFLNAMHSPHILLIVSLPFVPHHVLRLQIAALLRRAAYRDRGHPSRMRKLLLRRLWCMNTQQQLKEVLHQLFPLYSIYCRFSLLRNYSFYSFS